MMLFCGRLAPAVTTIAPAPASFMQKSALAPNVTYTYLSGTEPYWAKDADLDEELQYVFFEADVIYDAPVLSLSAEQVTADAGKHSS